jgi:hypothetical protein
VIVVRDRAIGEHWRRRTARPDPRSCDGVRQVEPDLVHEQGLAANVGGNIDEELVRSIDHSSRTGNRLGMEGRGAGLATRGGTLGGAERGKARGKELRPVVNQQQGDENRGTWAARAGSRRMGRKRRKVRGENEDASRFL